MQYANIDKDGYIRCPVHNKKLGRADDNAHAHGIHLWCSFCKDEITIDTRTEAQLWEDTKQTKRY